MQKKSIRAIRRSFVSPDKTARLPLQRKQMALRAASISKFNAIKRCQIKRGSNDRLL